MAMVRFLVVFFLFRLPWTLQQNVKSCWFDGWINASVIKAKDEGAKMRGGKKNTPAPTFRHFLWLRVPLKPCSIWGIAVATSIYGDGRTSTVKLGGHVDPWASALASVPQYSATQPDQKQRRLLHSSHGRETLCPFHSSAHGPWRSDKTTCWRVALNSMCHGLECFSFCACHCSGRPVATLDWFFEQRGKKSWDSPTCNL